MPAVFVNGNPENAAIWEPLLAELHRTDVMRLSPPGFGAAIPDDYDCTVPAYREWLTAELEALGEPVNLVGHDVGGGADRFRRHGQARPAADLGQRLPGVFDPIMPGMTSPGYGRRPGSARSRLRT